MPQWETTGAVQLLRSRDFITWAPDSLDYQNDYIGSSVLQARELWNQFGARANRGRVSEPGPPPCLYCLPPVDRRHSKNC